MANFGLMDFYASLPLLCIPGIPDTGGRTGPQSIRIARICGMLMVGAKILSTFVI